MLPFDKVEAVVVSGDGPNYCGHMLLRVDGFYFHVSGVYNYPMYMLEAQFPLYMRSNNKTGLFRTKRDLSNKTAAKTKLRELLDEKWLWLVLPNNCSDFVEEIIGAGENDFGIISNCPTQLAIKVEQEIRRQGMVLTRRGYRRAR